MQFDILDLADRRTTRFSLSGLSVKRARQDTGSGTRTHFEQFRRRMIALAAAASVVSMATVRLNAAATNWSNTGTDFNASASWSAGTPTMQSAATFTAVETVQPNLSANDMIAGLYFKGVNSSGYNLSRSNSATLTLQGYGSTGSSGTTNSSAAAVRNESTSGTDTVAAPLTLAPGSGTTSVFYQAAGGVLLVSGALSSGAGIDLSLKGAGTIELDGDGSGLASSSIDTASTTVVVGADNALGTGAFSINSTATLQADTSARTLANAVVLGGDTTISGSYGFTINGAITSSGSNTRALTVSNTGGLALEGNVYLSESNTTARSLSISNSTAVTIDGVVANNNAGNSLASPLSKSGAGVLTLTAANTYSGNTNISGGTLSVGNSQHTSASILSSPAVNLGTAAASTTLVLFSSVALDPNGTLKISTNGQTTTQTVDLDFNNASQTVFNFIVDGNYIAPGTYTVGTTFAGGDAVLAADNGYSGGSLTVVSSPEPAGTGLMLGGLSVGLLRRRRRVILGAIATNGRGLL